MLKERIIACLTIKNGIVVQSISFHRYLPIGKPEIAVEFLNAWGIDEIIILDLDARLQRNEPSIELLRKIAEKCFVPLTIGGGISTLDQIRSLIKNGADKISLNTEAVENPSLITEAARIFGSQAVIVSIDVREIFPRYFEVFTHGGTKTTGLDPVEWAKKASSLGAGEILLTSIDRDGSKQGYDLHLVKKIVEAVSIPVIACGGVGHPHHFLEGLREGKASAVAAGNYFHFTEHSPIITKAYLYQQGINVRLDTYANYKDVSFSENGRIVKKDDAYLEKIRFEYHPKEVI